MVPPIRRFDRLLSLDYYIDYTHMVLGLVAAEAAGPPSMAVAASSMVAVLGLVLVNGFFVAAEFSLVAARRSKLDEMIAKGDRAART
ncbi:MAG: CNNM domain-containing protein, partial [Gemmatimonadaceae bacterium]